MSYHYALTTGQWNNRKGRAAFKVGSDLTFAFVSGVSEARKTHYLPHANANVIHYHLLP